VQDSQALAANKQFVEAYELLDGLAEGPRAFVKEPMAALSDSFVKDAVARADTLARVHIPIRGRADEDGARQAFHYLDKASHLVEEEALKIKLDLVTDRISTYYLKEAKRLLEKPRGSGVGLGWLFLLEAQRFKPDLEGVKDQMTRYAPLYESRAQLSLGVRFRDQTSRRDSLGFADQLTDAVAAGLEGSGIPALKVLPRQERVASDGASDAAIASQPNFEVLGDILQHRVDKKQDTQRMSSRYRSGQREVRNPAWVELAHKIEAAQEESTRANEALRIASTTPKRNKRQMEAAQQAVESNAAAIKDLRRKQEGVPETLLQDVILPYNYTKRTVELAGIVELAFRVVDMTGTARELSNVKSEVPKKHVLLENVKSEDVEGVQEEATPPDETQLLAEAESQAQGSLTKKVTEKLRELPPRVLEEARHRVANKDPEGAAEAYILYMNMTRGSTGAERTEAERFLQQEFNLAPRVAVAQAKN